MKELERAFSRGCFTDGYYTGKIARGMTGVRSEEDKSASRALKAEIPSIEKMRLTARATIRRGAPSELTLSCIPCSRWGGLVGESLVASVLGDIPSEAINAPLDNASVAQRLAKMGATPFVLTPDDIEIELDGGLNLSPSALNSLRRAAAQALEDKLARPIRELCGESADKAAQDTVVSDNSSDAPLAGGFGDSLAVFYEPSVLMGLVKARSVHIRRLKRVFVPLARLPELYPDCARDIAELGSELGVMMPEVVMEHELRATVNMLKDASKSGVMTTLVCNIGQIELCKCLGFNLVGDLRLNVYNPDSRAAYISVGVDEISLSPELTLPQARDVGGYALVSGRAPLMITERCFIKESFDCDKCGKAALTDRRGARFPILRTADHRNLIFNSAPTYMGDKREELRRVGSIGEYFIFSIESLDEAQNILSSYFGGKPIGGQVRRMGKRPVE